MRSLAVIVLAWLIAWGLIACNRSAPPDPAASHLICRQVGGFDDGRIIFAANGEQWFWIEGAWFSWYEGRRVWHSPARNESCNVTN